LNSLADSADGGLMKSAKDIDLVAYCGLNCQDCHGFKGRISDLARDLRKELREERYDKFARMISAHGFGRALGKYDECYQALGAMVKFRCKKGCRDGGGSPYCEIRKCCKGKEIEGCWKCSDFETCEKLDFLRPVHGSAVVKNLRALSRKGPEAFVSGKSLWYSPEG